MIHSQASKAFIVTSPGVIKDDTAWTTNEIDTKGFDYIAIYLIVGATDIAFPTGGLSVEESDASGSGMADITGLVYGATGATALPTATDDDKIFAFFINLQGRKRYLNLNATAGNGAAGTYMAAIAILSRAEESANTNTERGLGGLLRLPA